MKYTSDIVGTSISDFTDENTILLTFEMLYEGYLDFWKDNISLDEYIDMISSMSKELDVLYNKNSKKVERREIKDPTANFKEFLNISGFKQGKEAINNSRDYFLLNIIPMIEKNTGEPLSSSQKTKLTNGIKDISKKLIRVMDVLEKSIEVSTIDTETFEGRVYASLNNTVDAEKYNIGIYPAYEIGDGSSNDVSDVMKMFGPTGEKLKLVRNKIDGSKKLKLINDLVPVYKAHRDYVEAKKEILDDPNYKAYKEAKEKDDLDVGFERSLGKNNLFRTLALWYSDWGDDVRNNLFNLIIPILKKHLSFDLFLDETIGSDSYIYIAKKDGTVYDLIFDITHDGDDFSLRVVDFDVVKYIKDDIEMNS